MNENWLLRANTDMKKAREKKLWDIKHVHSGHKVLSSIYTE